MNLIAYLRKEAAPLKVLAGPFRGARLILNPSCSKRKLIGAYEHVLNPWLKKVLSSTKVFYDVGANDGYYTYGCAQSIKRHGHEGHVIAFEPALSETPTLTIPAGWHQYEGINFEFIPKLVGAVTSENAVTLEQVYGERTFLHDLESLIKVDVEGEEVEVLKGAAPLLREPYHWVIEVHGDHLLEPVLEFFRNAHRQVTVHAPVPHWLLGPEQRSISTSWVTTDIP